MIRSDINTISLDALLDTGAIRSCINYTTFNRLGGKGLAWKATPTVMGADGSDLGTLGTVTYKIPLGTKQVEQDFIVCKQLKCNVILGIDFTKTNYAGVSWTTEGTRVLTLGGTKVIELAEDQLGDVVTLARTVNIPPRHGAVCEVVLTNKPANTKNISPNPQTLENNPTMY